MKFWAEEKGSMQLVEGTVLFPVTFIALFLLLFFMLSLFVQVDQEAKLRLALAQPTTSVAFGHPEESYLAKALLPSSQWSETGLFFVQRQIQQQKDVHALPFRFFSLPALHMEQQRSGVWSSSSTNLWRLEAVNGFCAQQAQNKGGALERRR